MLDTAILQKGFTLIELMTASVISLTALSAIVTVYAATARHTTAQLSRADLRQQLHTVTELMASDIRRNGYWAFDPLTTSPAENPFERPENRVRSSALDGEPSASCLLFSYDLDRDGQVGKGRCQPAGCTPEADNDNVEQFGYRLSRGRIQVRYGGTGAACNSGYWQTVTTPAVVIDELSFTLYSNCLNLEEPLSPCSDETPTLIRRAVEFSVEGSLARNSAVTLGLSRWVDLRNAQLQRPQE